MVHIICTNGQLMTKEYYVVVDGLEVSVITFKEEDFVP